jgi:hypothetical protein
MLMVVRGTRINGTVPHGVETIGHTEYDVMSMMKIRILQPLARTHLNQTIQPHGTTMAALSRVQALCLQMGSFLHLTLHWIRRQMILMLSISLVHCTTHGSGPTSTSLTLLSLVSFSISLVVMHPMELLRMTCTDFLA